MWFLLLSVFLLLSFFLAKSQLRRLNAYAYVHTWRGLSANLGCRCETCCTRLTENTGRKNSPSGYHSTTLTGCIFFTKAHIDNRIKCVNSNISPTCPHNMVNFGSEICWRVWGTRANFNGFRVLASLLHGTRVWASAKVCGVEQRAPPTFDRAAHRTTTSSHQLRPSGVYCCRPDCLELAARLSP